MSESASSIFAMSARAIATGVRERRFSATEVFDAVAARVTAENPGLNAIIGFDPDWSRAQAKALDARLASDPSARALPLAGVPVTVKDNLWVKGRRISQGSRLFEHFVAPEDAWAVGRLRECGAILLGITNCSEFACKGVSNNLLHGKTRSPWDERLTPGGSSGGAASAVAAGFGPLALVTDAGGSTRRPAAHCGLVGMKPSFGVIPAWPGFEEPNFGLSVVGQIARNVGDAALMLDCLGGFSARDPVSQRLDMAQLKAGVDDAGLRSLRIAFSRNLGCGFAIDADVLAVMEGAVASLRGAGYEVEDADPVWPKGTAAYPLIALQQAGLAALYGREFEADRSRFDPDIAVQIELGLKTGGPAIAETLLLRERIYASLHVFFGRYDALICPTSPVTSWPVDQLGPPVIGGLPAGPRGHAAYTPLFNYCGVPACSVPAGLVRGLPVGLQVVAPRYQDGRVLALARVLESLLDLNLVPVDPA